MDSLEISDDEKARLYQYKFAFDTLNTACLAVDETVGRSNNFYRRRFSRGLYAMCMTIDHLLDSVEDEFPALVAMVLETAGEVEHIVPMFNGECGFATKKEKLFMWFVI